MRRESIFWRGSEQFKLAAMARAGWKFPDESLCLSEIGLVSGGRRRIAKQAVSVGNPPVQNQNRAKAPSPRGMPHALPPRAQFVIVMSVTLLAFKGAGAGRRKGRDAGIPSTTRLFFCAYCIFLSVLPFSLFFPRDQCAHGGSYLAARC